MDAVLAFIKAYPELTVLTLVVVALWLVSDSRWTHREP